jgi:site-specific recombinase XerD
MPQEPSKTAVRTASVKRYARDADTEDVGRVSPHTLRHAFATRLYRKTGKTRMVQKALGHSDLSTTMIYTHVVDEELEGQLRDSNLEMASCRDTK